jgi:hypothetical protein
VLRRGKVGYNCNMSQPKAVNPFYVAALPAGVIFAITACSYMVMAYRGLNPHHSSESGLVGLMDRHGMAILLVELAILGVLTVAAITTDGFWTRRFEAAQPREES